MGETAEFQYKCRRCGAVFGGSRIVASEANALFLRKIAERDQSVHTCEGMTGAGVGDLAGFRILEESPADE